MKLFSHLHTIHHHRFLVFIHSIKAGIPLQGLVHDLSKYSPEEFWPSVKHYQGTRSPNEGEREDYGFSYAWLHHKGRNKHHFEYWRDVNPKTRLYEPVPMPMKYVVEMFCDRIAASKTYKGKDYKQSDALEYFEKGHAKEMMHPQTATLIQEWLTILSERGEREAFRIVKQQLKESKKK